jgi:GNAT superfamily N-acetyltransferase
MDYVIRPCEEKDLPELVRLCASHAKHEKASYNHEGKQEGLKEAIFGDHKKLNCWDAAPFLYMDCLFLNENCRGKGIGQEIMKRIQKVARDKKCVNIQWQTPEFNVRAIRFYVGLGSTGKQKMRFFLKP